MFDVLRYDSFYSVWYWALTVVVWTYVTTRTLGVPHDMLLRARRVPEVAARVETLARIGAERLAGLADAVGTWMAAAGGFGLAMLAGLGFWTGIEAAEATFFLLLPLATVFAGHVRLARRIRRLGPSGDELVAGLAARRRRDQWIAALGMLIAVVAALGHPPRPPLF